MLFTRTTEALSDPYIIRVSAPIIPLLNPYDPPFLPQLSHCETSIGLSPPRIVPMPFGAYMNGSFNAMPYTNHEPPLTRGGHKLQR